MTSIEVNYIEHKIIEVDGFKVVDVGSLHLKQWLIREQLKKSSHFIARVGQLQQ